MHARNYMCNVFDVYVCIRMYVCVYCMYNFMYVYMYICVCMYVYDILQRELKSQMKVEKLIAPKVKPKSPAPPPRTPTPPPPPPRSPTPPPPTPLPEYISQFIGQSWFDSLFPNASSKV